jgi:AcrR family transcriptional regulator
MIRQVTSTTVDRAEPLVGRIARVDHDPRRWEAVALGLVDALMERDAETLAAALDALRNARARADGEPDLAGRLDTAIAFAHWGLERVPSATPVAQGTQAYNFLRAMAGSAQMGSAELRAALGTDETQVSRTGRRLLESGLVTRRKAGRQVFWQLSPRGRRALEDAPSQSHPDHSDFWQEALRRGFEAVSGDEPGERREVDPTRERIIESTLELHLTNGIKATTWQQIAAKAALPVETVEELFPTLDDLTRSCGAHFFERLGLAPRDRAAEVFADTSSEDERVHRLVETFFGVYERGADGITLARRERDVAAARESVDAIDSALDAIVAEALRPRAADDASVASVRALTDVEVWRSLRQRGATTQAAVDETSATVERWLEARS